ncbi:hypothetical protein COLO4_32968 [Corchorus olitorius]|uniref:SHSP domain-containing protein n=1 Tax=Corchorus olitorius TaxID=93759 RepID=A0A1R3GX36_9ROSI|nr:hypothetical protein COLO4_32968 [Corchorus olitorius]
MKKEESTEPCIDDFEPYCKWRKEQESSVFKEIDIVEIQLHGFKKEELKLEIGNDGFLCISGEHPIGRNVKRFNKRIDVSKYDNENVEAEFENGILRITLPKKSYAINFSFGNNKEIVGISLSRPHILKNITNCVVGFALLFLLVAFVVYKYCDCTEFLNWVKRLNNF